MHRYLFLFPLFIIRLMGKITHYALTKIYYAFSRNNKHMSDERKVKKGGRKWKIMTRKTKEYTAWNLFQRPLFIMLLSNPTHSEISDINLFII